MCGAGATLGRSGSEGGGLVCESTGSGVQRCRGCVGVGAMCKVKWGAERVQLYAAA